MCRANTDRPQSPLTLYVFDFRALPLQHGIRVRSHSLKGEATIFKPSSIFNH
ncbi:hypothetical protein [Chlorogloeopsis sp. ULAP01]|uniref:hypothetical protein n=1 Tax=Chlorogloeopsis sp. ULAP01 TaxID=3056483 RepID=UPI0025ABCA91|nr:hypothetical protein [Chlorogloeopsis sp. ULAP01]